MVKIPPIIDIKGIGMLFLRPYLQVNGDCRTFAGKENDYSFGSNKMELNRELSTSCWKLSQQSWLDDSVGCCWHIWYCPF